MRNLKPDQERPSSPNIKSRHQLPVAEKLEMTELAFIVLLDPFILSMRFEKMCQELDQSRVVDLRQIDAPILIL